MSGNLINEYINTHAPNKVSNVNFRADETPPEKPATPANPDMENDSLAFLEMYAKLKVNADISTDGLMIREGKINGSDALVKTVLISDAPHACNIEQEGSIGSKKFLLDADSVENKDKEFITYKGEFNNKQVDLTVEVPKDKNKVKSFFVNLFRHKMYVPPYVNIKGSIDGKPYELTLPDAKVPRDTDEKDIVSLLLFNERLIPAVINGNIAALKPDMVRVNRWKRGIDKQDNFFKENFKPLLDQTIAMVFGGFLTMLSTRMFTKK